MFYELIGGKVYYAHLNNDPNIYATTNTILANSGATISQQIQVLTTKFQCDNVSYLKQIHGCNSIYIEDKAISGNIEADALITNQSNHIICVKTADCVPILLSTLSGDAISIIHAGWRGALNGIITNTISKLRLKMEHIDDVMIAVIGPHIRQNSYEVDQNFYQQFLTNNNDNHSFFIPSTNTERYLFDLTAFVTRELYRAGVEDMIDTRIDTYTEELYPSYRRATHQNTSLSSHMLSAIVIIE